MSLSEIKLPNVNVIDFLMNVLARFQKSTCKAGQHLERSRLGARGLAESKHVNIRNNCQIFRIHEDDQWIGLCDNFMHKRLRRLCKLSHKPIH